jgi:hypothetical protein
MPSVTPGIKGLSNETGVLLQLVLFVRKGTEGVAILRNDNLTLRSNERVKCTYGSASDPYLSGLRITGLFQNDMKQTTQTVMKRGSPLDAVLNTHTVVRVRFDGQNFTLWPENPWPVPDEFYASNAAPMSHADAFSRFGLGAAVRLPGKPSLPGPIWPSGIAGASEPAGPAFYTLETHSV